MRLLNLMIRAALLAILVGLMSWGAGFAAKHKIPNRDIHQNTEGTTINTCLECHFSSDSSKTHSKMRSKTYSLTAAGTESDGYASYHNGFDCTDCHDMHGGGNCGDYQNLRFIFCEIDIDLDPFITDLRPVIFTCDFSAENPCDPYGTNSYADGDTNYDGVCEVCHTQTRHHRNDGSQEDDGHYAGTDCIVCHSHSDAFSHGGGAGCDACHGHDEGYEYAPGQFSEGAGSVQSHSTHTENDSDDLKGPFIPCDACHDTANYPYFKSGTDGDGNGVFDLSETDVCDTCHSPLGAFDGVNDPAIGVKTNWADGIYKADGVTLKSGKEKWCAGCHDNEPAFSSSNSIQIIMDDDEATYVGTWPLISNNSCAHESDFRYNDAGTGFETATWIPNIPESGNYDVYVRWVNNPNRASNAPYTINYNGGSETVYKDCRVNGCQWNLLGTYPFAAGTSGYIQLTDNADGYVNADAIMITTSGTVPGIYAPNVIGDNSTYGFYTTGHGAHGWVECLSCHNAGTKHIDHKHRTYASASNNYQAGYRLAKPMVIPRPNRNDIYSNLNDFALCNDCHNPYEVLGVNYSDESHTNFRAADQYLRNGHNVHIKMNGKVFDSDWDRVLDSMPTCITCHNVHGPPNQAMVRHGELMSTYGTTDKVPGLNFSYLTSLSPRVCDTEVDVKDSVASTLQWVDSSFGVNGFCNGACHGTKTMIRTPYLGPKVLTKKAYPNSVPADGTTEVFITALVADHNDNVPLDGVTIDLSPIDGGVETMYDDGINGGDLTAGDNTYSYTLTVPITVASGFKSLHITATDPDGMGEGNITLHVQAPGEIILDNTEATYKGTWPSYANPTAYGGDFQSHEAGSGANTATWTPTIFEAGYYNVYAWWTSHSNRASNAPYTINHSGSSETVRVNQKVNGGKWNLLGTYPFAVGTSGSVVLSDDVNGYVIADAIKFERADPNVIIRDNINAVYVGTWPSFANLMAYGGEAQYHEAGSGGNTATWTPLILEAGNYNVYAWWVAHANRATNALYTINYAGSSAEVRVTQRINGGQWNLLGTYPFAAGTSGSVVLTDDANGYINADAIKFELQP
jgi:hypothetical protein